MFSVIHYVSHCRGCVLFHYKDDVPSRDPLMECEHSDSSDTVIIKDPDELPEDCPLKKRDVIIRLFQPKQRTSPAETL